MSLRGHILRWTFKLRNTLTLLAFTLPLLVPSSLFGSPGVVEADTFIAPPFDNYWRWESGYREHFRGPYGTWYVTARSWGYCFYYDGETRNVPVLGWWYYIRGIKGGVLLRVFALDDPFWAFAGFYEQVYIPEGTSYIKVKANIKTVQPFVAYFSYPYSPSLWNPWARARVYFQVCIAKGIDGLPNTPSWDSASTGYTQLLFTLGPGERVDAEKTWTPEITIDLGRDNIGPGWYYIYFGLLAYADARLSIYESSYYSNTPWWARNDCAFQFQSISITFTRSLTVKDPRVALSFTSPIDWRLEDEDSSVGAFPKGWTEPSGPSGPTKLAFGDFFKVDVYAEVEGGLGEDITLRAFLSKEYFWTIDPTDPFNRTKYVEGGEFLVTKKITEDDLKKGLVCFSSDKVFRVKPFQEVDYTDVPVTITISYGRISKTFTANVRLASIRPEIRQVWGSPFSCVIKVYGVWCDDGSKVKNRPYLYYGLDLESRRICMKSGIDSEGYSYAKTDPLDPHILRPTGYAVNKQSLMLVTSATEEFALRSSYVEYRELAISVLQRSPSELRLRVYEYKEPYNPVPNVRVTLMVKDLNVNDIREYTKTANLDGCVTFSRSELSLSNSYELWACAWGSDGTGVLYGRSPFGCILLERA